MEDEEGGFTYKQALESRLNELKDNKKKLNILICLCSSKKEKMITKQLQLIQDQIRKKENVEIDSFLIKNELEIMSYLQINNNYDLVILDKNYTSLNIFTINSCIKKLMDNDIINQLCIITVFDRTEKPEYGKMDNMGISNVEVISVKDLEGLSQILYYPFEKSLVESIILGLLENKSQI